MMARRAALLCALVILVTFGAGIRHLDGRSLWIDETLAFTFCYQNSLEWTITRHVAGDVHPPLYFILLNLWLDLTGDAVFTMRYLSLLIFALAVAAAYHLGRLWAREMGAALLLALLVGVSLFGVHWARNARMYTLLLLAGTLALDRYIAWYRGLGRPRGAVRRRLLLAGALAMALYTHYFGFLVVAALAVHFLLARRPTWRRWEQMLGVVVLGCLPFLLWARTFMYQFVASDGSLVHAQGSRQALESLLNMLFSQAAAPFLVFYVLGMAALWRAVPRRDRLLAVVMGPGVVALALALNTQMHTLVERNLVFVLPAAMFPIAWGIWRLPRPAMALAALALVALSFHSYRSIAPERQRYPWDRFVSALAEHVEPEDYFAVGIRDIWTFEYYRERMLSSDHPAVHEAPEVVPAGAPQFDYMRADRLWLITIIERPEAPPRLLPWLSEFIQEDEIVVEGLRAVLYVRFSATETRGRWTS